MTFAIPVRSRRQPVTPMLGRENPRWPGPHVPTTADGVRSSNRATGVKASARPLPLVETQFPVDSTCRPIHNYRSIRSCRPIRSRRWRFSRRWSFSRRSRFSRRSSFNSAGPCRGDATCSIAHKPQNRPLDFGRFCGLWANLTEIHVDAVWQREDAGREGLEAVRRMQAERCWR